MVIMASDKRRHYSDPEAYPVEAYFKLMRAGPLPYLEYFHKELQFLKSNIRRGSKVLEVGCGEGRLLVPLAVHVGVKGRVVGIDYNTRMLDLAQRNCEVLSNAEAMYMDAKNLNEFEETFDYVVFTFNFLGNVPQSSQIPILRGARKRTNPDGKILATVYSEDGAAAQFSAYYPIWPKSDFRVDRNFVGAGEPDFQSERFSCEKIQKMFSSARLKPRIRRLTSFIYGIDAKKS